MDWNYKVRNTHLLSSAATSLALLLSAAATPALAQEAQAAAETEAEGGNTLDVITVVGIRGSIENAIGLKKTSDSIVEVISAEDIGKLPDVSIAESLARLPGLAIQRIDGRGQQLSIRGLGPDYTTALLNGREQVTVGDNRGVEFDQFPSDLLSGVVVYKTPEASLLGQGLMGTVDMRTLRPLSQSERIVAAGARYEWNEKGALNAGSDDTGYRLNLTYADKFMNDKLGVAIGVSSISTPTQSERFNAWGYPNFNAQNLVIGGSKPYVQSNDLDRDGVFGMIEFEPTDTFRTSVDLYYSNFSEEQTLRGIELPLQWSSATLQPGFTASNGLITQGVFGGVKGVVRNDVNLRETDLFAAGWNAEWDVGDNWTLGADLSYSEANRDDTILETYSGTGPNGVGATDNLGFRLIPDGGVRFSPTLNYGDYNAIVLTSPQGWGTDAAAGRPFGQAGFLNKPSTTDQLTALRLTAERELEIGPISGMEIGANFSSREKEKTVNEFFLAVANGAASAPIPQNLRLGTTNLAYLGLGPMVSYDPLALLASGALTQSRNNNADVVTKAWSVTEDVQTAYLQFNLDSEIGAMPLRGNFGVQVVRTDQSSSGAQGTGGLFRTVTAGADYTEVLPSANVIVNVTDDTVVRVAAARTLARARMDQLRASQELQRNESRLLNTDPTSSYFSSSGGNPELKPYIADGIDLSVEHYFGGAGYVSLAGYYKKIDNWVFGSVGEIVDFAAFTSLIPAADRPLLGTTRGIYSSPRNVEGGWIQGLEFAVSIPGDVIAPQLEGFGLIFSASTTDSEIEPLPGVTISVPGLSETVTNTTVYFERAGFQARLSSRYRSSFLGEVTGFGAGRDLRQVDAETVLDGQIGYSFENGPLQGLSILFQAYNLTDEPFRTYVPTDERLTIDYQEYGSTYLIGLSYKLN